LLDAAVGRRDGIDHAARALLGAYVRSMSREPGVTPLGMHRRHFERVAVTVSGSLRRISLDTVKHLAAAADRVQPPRRGVVILIYHRIGGGAGVELDLPTAVFDEQMRRLSGAGVGTTLDHALTDLESEHAHQRNPVVVTFDDGTADFVDAALPVLERHRVPALLYLATSFVEANRALPYGGRPLSWAGLRDALSSGLVTIGSHTHSHAVLDRLSPNAIDEELRRSRELIAEHLGVAADHFAYPKGVARSRAADVAVRRVFRSAATGEIRTNRYRDSDPYRLGRTPIQSSDGIRWFDRKAAGGMTLEGALRGALNRVRYKGAAN
jgi:peptidoglycan/xylan/chitin deacetylase (PgdA/CDA1 family)